MDYQRAIAISAAGLLAQKSRVEAAAQNLANANTTSAPGQVGYRPITAVLQASPVSFSNALQEQPGASEGPQVRMMPITGQAPRLSYEPGHPHANAQGMVAYPPVDHAREMLTVTTALRTYEANLAVLQVTKSLAIKSLDIGAQ